MKQVVLFAITFALLLAAIAFALAPSDAMPAKVCRSAVTGKVVTPAYAAANTATTICARRKPPVRK